MSADYDFWKYKAGAAHDDQRIYELLSDGETLEELQGASRGRDSGAYQSSLF